MNLKEKIRTIPDFPKKGIMFRDITPLLQDPDAFRHVTQKLVNKYRESGVDVVACAESRGFIFGAALAHELRASFVPVRKPGKLPYKKLVQEFEKEYGKDSFEIHQDAFEPGNRVLFVDDLLATGGTAKAALELIEKLEGDVVGAAFIIELRNLKGRDKLRGYHVHSIVNY